MYVKVCFCVTPLAALISVVLENSSFYRHWDEKIKLDFGVNCLPHKIQQD